MLSRLAKSLAVKASISRTARPVARYGKYLGKQISIFWNKPRIDAPRPVEAKQRTGCYEAEDPEFTCAFEETLTMDELLCAAVTAGGILLAAETLGRSCEKYSLIKEAKQEWDTKSELEKRVLTAEMNGGSLCLSGAQDHERVEGVDSMDSGDELWQTGSQYLSGAQDHEKVDRVDSMNSGKWAWILQRATEMEKESPCRT
jgi:hypothetical protein